MHGGLGSRIYGFVSGGMKQKQQIFLFIKKGRNQVFGFIFGEGGGLQSRYE
jgi:hypothetical protein